MFYMFHVLWCLVSCATIGVAVLATTDHLRNRDNGAGIGNNSAEFIDGTAGIVDIADESRIIGSIARDNRMLHFAQIHIIKVR